MKRYRIIYSDSEAGLVVAAGPFKILANTVREFDILTSNTDLNPDCGSIDMQTSGWIALARLEV